MAELTEAQKKKLLKLSEFMEDKDLSTFESLFELAEKVEGIKESFNEKFSSLDETLKKKSEEELFFEIDPEEIRGEKGEDGEKGTDGKDGRDGKDGKDGKNGRDGKEGEDGTDGKDGADGNIKDLSPDEIRDSLELLKDEDRLDASAIKNLDKYLKQEKGNTVFVGAPTGGGRIVKAYDLTSQLNGVLKTFNLPAMWRVISVHSSSFPYSFRETVDFTWTSQSITFTSEITASSTLATGQTVTIIYAEA